ncbi:transposase [Arachidicoccus ginsenosidimutans]|uniref:IS200/IS605 family transposase n=1 Tax=Arachidicoccus sp. BS20 TaxID=1850526 RepID=UPI0007F1504B|nr:IS200/IS605 family transposase [Arachidicoccus sp. BS20]ANI88134.1 transposase [Arachidicoccus sp. BS20]
MSTYTQILYQIVYSTKNREATLNAENRKELYKYIWGILKNKNCHLYQIGGIENHLHIVTHLHPSVALADLVKNIKLASTDYIKSKNLFPDFTGWQDGYGAFTYSVEAKENLINYVKNQEEHHRKKTFVEEYKELLNEHNIEFDEKYLL